MQVSAFKSCVQNAFFWGFLPFLRLTAKKQLTDGNEK
jgi:hypothetical protein